MGDVFVAFGIEPAGDENVDLGRAQRVRRPPRAVLVRRRQKRRRETDVDVYLFGRVFGRTGVALLVRDIREDCDRRRFSLGAGVRLGLDQLAFAPVFLATFLSALFAIEGNTDKLPNKLKQDLFPTVVANWKIWVPFQFLNFRFVPANLQVGAANVIALAWNVYLSWASHKKVPEVVIEGKNTKKKGGKR